MPSTIPSIRNPIVNKTEKSNRHFGLVRVVKVIKKKVCIILDINVVKEKNK